MRRDGIRRRRAARLAIRQNISYGLRRTRMARKKTDKQSDQRGQAMMEYILTVIVCVAPLLIFWSILLVAMRNYIKGVYFFASLPLP